MKRSTEEGRLVPLSQAGDRAAFDRLLRALQADLFRYLCQSCGDVHLAEDLLQEVFLTLYRKLRWLREPTLVRPWAYRIAHRAAQRRLRRRRGIERTRPLQDEPVQPPAEGPDFDLTRLPEWMSELTPLCRGVVRLHYIEQAPLHVIARTLDVPLGTVKSRLAYGLRQLRRVARRSL